MPNNKKKKKSRGYKRKMRRWDRMVKENRLPESF